jgi:gamma-glutamylcyclotransferase (GGCT)/AIG2-like uncharacterized protein YtfP
MASNRKKPQKKKAKRDPIKSWGFYFAFGSNLSIEQMRRRCPDSIVITPATLDDHRIVFAGSSSIWGGFGVATVEHAKGSTVPGLLYLVSDRDLRRLDRAEGHPRSYVREAHNVDVGEVSITAWTYVKHGARKTRPSGEYLRIIAEGYEMIGADDEHRATLADAAAAPAPAREPVRVRAREGGGARWFPAPYVAPAYRRPADGRQIAADDVPSAGGGLRAMARDAWQAGLEAVSEVSTAMTAAPDRVTVAAYDAGRFDADRFIDRVVEALRAEGNRDEADAFVNDVMIAETHDEDDLIDLASRYVDVDVWGDDEAPAWWFDGEIAG